MAVLFVYCINVSARLFELKYPRFGRFSKLALFIW